MRCLFLYATLLLLLSNNAYGQNNLVPNPSFESYSSCPSGSGQVTAVCTGWKSWNSASPDYYNSCNTGTTVSVPVNWFGYQYAAHGNGFVGIVDNWSSGSWREYVTSQMTPMQQGALYEVSLSVSSADAMKLATNGLGVFFFDQGPTSLSGGNISGYTPHLSFASYGAISDTAGWTRLKGYVYADSAYDNIVIGTFLPYNQMTINTTGWGSYNASYYYIDSIVVTLADTLFATPADSIFCAGDTININYYTLLKYQSNNTFTIQISDATGSFSSPVNIGSKNSDTSGTITCTIPSNTPTGSGYRMRIIASNMADTSHDNGFNIKIGSTVSKPVAGNNGPLCLGDTLKLSATSSSSVITWSWSGPNGFTSGQQNPQIINVSSSASGNYIVTASIYGCMAKDTTSVVVLGGTGPVKATAGSNSPLCEGDTLKLIDLGSSTGFTYSWTGPGGFTCSKPDTQILNATTANAGKYILKISNTGCYKTDTVEVVINTYPSVTITSNSPLCTGDNLTFSIGNPTSGASYTWGGPNSFSATGATTSLFGVWNIHSGDYYVSGTFNGCTSFDTMSVLVKPLPIKPTAANNSPLCSGETLNLTANTSTTGISYSWAGPGAYTSSQQNPSITNTATTFSGDYIVSATLNGCTTKDTTTVTINPSPTPVNASTNAPLCAGDSLQITIGSSSSGVTYNWSGPNSFSANTQNTGISNTVTGHTGWYVATLTLGSCIYKDSAYAVINAIPPKPSASFNDPLCINETLQLNASNINNATYSWSGPSSFVSNSKNAIRNNIQQADTGTYKVIATVNGCNSLPGSVKVHVNPLPFVVISAGNDSICKNELVMFNAFPNNYGGTPQYQWYVNAQAVGMGQTFSTTTLNNGDIINCKMTENTKCSSPYTDASNDVKMTVLPWLTPAVSITADKTGPIHANEYITFTATPVDAGNKPGYQWKRNGKDIIGAKGSTWSANTLNDNDTICVELTSSYKCPQPVNAFSNCIVVSVLSGVNELNTYNVFAIYPNPTNSNITIESQVNGKITLQSIDGRTLLNDTIVKGKNTMSMPYPSGVYMITIIDKEGHYYREKIVKQ